MPNRIKFLLLIVGILASGAGTSAAVPARHVVLITLDGFAAYLLDDPASPVPTLRRLAERGTTAAGVTPVNPSVTWPNHTTLITGAAPRRHSVLFNGVLVRPGPGRAVRVDPARDQSDLIAMPTIFEAMQEAKLATAAVNWPCLRNCPCIDDNFPDVPEQMNYTTPRLREALVDAKVLAAPTQEAFAALSAPAKDQVWTAAACDIIRRRKPALLALHLLVTDGVHHKYGPQSLAGYAALAQVDFEVREVLRAIEDAGIADDTAIIVTADHGFAKAEKLILPNVLLVREKMLKIGPTGVPLKGKVQAVPEGGTAFLYLLDPSSAAADRRRVRELFEGQEGISQIIEPAQFGEYGLPDPADNPQAPDLVLAAADGYGFGGGHVGADWVRPIDAARENAGYHGYLSSNPKMQALFIAAGAGIGRGKKIDGIRNLDIAPTIARLLGVPLPAADGKPLTALLEASPADAGWEPLFNNKDLSGWKSIGPAKWRVEEGVIVGGQDGDASRWGLLVTEQTWQNFELELEFMIDEHGKYNSGVYLRNDPSDRGRTGYQINIGRAAAEEYCGGLYTDHWLAKGDETDAIRKPLQWNSLRILADGAHTRVHLNGNQVVNFTDPAPDPKFLQPGVLALQTYGAEGHSGWVKFKNMRIRKIEPAKKP